jgi:hypothetical protein
MDKFITQIKLIFIVFGISFEPHDFTKNIGIKPTNFWKKGDQIKTNTSLRKDNRFLPTRKESAWEYSLGFFETLDFQEVSKKFENIFLSKTEFIKKYIEENKLTAKVDIVVEIANSQTPSLYLDKQFVSLVYSLGAEIDIDTYIFQNE